MEFEELRKVFVVEWDNGSTCSIGTIHVLVGVFAKEHTAYERGEAFHNSHEGHIFASYTVSEMWVTPDVVVCED